MKRALALGAVTGLMAFGIAPVAHAGEITGNGTATKAPSHAKSFCAFSGLDDVDLPHENPNDPTTDDFGRTQNYGQIRKVAGKLPFTPATSGCNPNRPPAEGPH